MKPDTMVTDRAPFLMALLASTFACRDAKPSAGKDSRSAAPTIAKQTDPELAELNWTMPMSNDLLQEWVAICGQPTAEPMGEVDGIAIWLGDPTTGTNCMLKYVQKTMTFRDIQISTRATDPVKAQDAFKSLTSQTVMPLLPLKIRPLIQRDIEEKKTYVSKPLGAFTVAMRKEDERDQTIRWLWVHYEPPTVTN
jgi:hypothetical protein